MPWNRTTRKDYKRNAKRYESDVTDKEWTIIEPMLPNQGRLGRPRKTDLREVFNAIQYVLATGCQSLFHKSVTSQKQAGFSPIPECLTGKTPWKWRVFARCWQEDRDFSDLWNRL